MKIGILGSGIVGQTLGAGFLNYSHQVMLGTRDPQKADVQTWLKKTRGAEVGTFARAAQFGELVVLAPLGRVVADVVKLAGPENLAEKAIIDTINPIADAPPLNGVLAFTTGPNESLAEKIQALVPRSHVVKAFTSVGSGRMVNPQYEQGTPTMFLCGDECQAAGYQDHSAFGLGAVRPRWHRGGSGN
jgi:8-hydroxy-5-deazaflavin:NADPH oxidoreductase